MSKVKKVTKSTVCACGNAKESSELACDVCKKALTYAIAEEFNFIKRIGGEIQILEFIELMLDRGLNEVGICSICGGHYVWGGHSSHPLMEDDKAVCCVHCNETVVIPARINALANDFK